MKYLIISKIADGNLDECHSLNNLKNVSDDYKMCNYTTGQKRLILGREKYDLLCLYHIRCS